MLSHTAEDYLEQIYLLSIRKEHVRTTDIARAFGVKTPSVISALKSLKEKGFVSYERYGDVGLSEKGLARAQSIYERHKALYRFLRLFLGVPDGVASRDACGMEHAMSRETQDALDDWTAFLRHRNNAGDDIAKSFAEFRKTRTDRLIEGNRSESLKLSEAKQGHQYVVTKTGGAREIKRRFLDMGLLPGENLSVRNRGPMGFPMEVLIQGYVLSLRKDEAEAVQVQEV